VKTKKSGVTNTISIQSWLRPDLTPVAANKDYTQFRDQLDGVAGLLKNAHLESMAIDFGLEGYEEASVRQQQSRARFALKALRVETLRMLLGNPSFVVLSRHVAASDLLADFCGVRQIDAIRGIAKSTLDRAAKFFTAEQVRWMMQVVLEMGAEEDRCQELGLERAIDTSVCLVDTTCLDANIHFPVDWVLLRDVATTLLKAIKLIRQAGLCQRMPGEPEVFARQMSRLCIEMTHTRRKDDAKKSRKSVLRRMKPLLKTIAEHARRHRDRLSSDYASTCYSEAQASRIIERIDRMLAQVPTVIKQAHERMIGERQVPSSDKILSVHESDIHVIVRGKAGREVEFGNTLFLAESKQGLILDWEFYRERAPSEPKQLKESLKRQNAYDLSATVEAACGDRGFNSELCSKELMDNGIFDAVCPKNPEELKQRMKDERFAKLQRRRGSTEARIAIFKQRQAGRLRCRGFDNRHRAVAWGVLGHNLWLISRLLAQQKSQEDSALAA
jgi:hypothetical protein